MSVQGIAASPAVPLPTILPADAADPDAQKGGRQAPRQGSGITITRIDKQNYPDGYVVTTTTYANADRAIRTAPKQQAALPPPPLRSTGFDPANGAQLSTLLSAQENTRGVAPVGINPYAR